MMRAFLDIRFDNALTSFKERLFLKRWLQPYHGVWRIPLLQRRHQLSIARPRSYRRAILGVVVDFPSSAGREETERRPESRG
jgi:hypothetical protein